MKIKKFIVLLISMVGLMAVSSLISFAVDSVTSPLEEPQAVYDTVDGHKHIKGACIRNNGLVDGKYNVTIFDLYSSSNANFYIFPDVCVVCDNPITGSVTTYDVESGNLVHQASVNVQSVSNADGYYQLKDYYCCNVSYGSGAQRDVFFIKPDIDLKYNAFVRIDHWVEPYVVWAISTPEQTSYVSSLSEPVADKYNAYFVLNDRLIWVSYKINTYYQLSNSIENESVTYNSSGSIQEQGSSVYVEHGTVAWDNTQTNNHTGEGAFFTGQNTTSAFYEDLSNLSSNVYGLCTFNSNGTLSYLNKVYYPVSYSDNIYSDPYELCLTLETNQEIHLNFIRHSDLTGVLLDANLYMSEFDLADGAYVKSWTKHVVSDLMNKTGWTISLSDNYKVESLRCYGCAFINENNIPVNLSNVLWQYDIEFKGWRDNMYTRLTQIYNLLAGTGEDIPETTTYRDFGGELGDAESNFSNMTPQNAKNVFNKSLSDGDYGSSASQIKAWIDKFSVPEIITLCVFALTLGTVTLTLGKKKSE